jgi:hypothetical protein
VGSHQDLLKHTGPTFERFAERHGYELVTGREIVGDAPCAWEKLRLTRELLDDHEEVLWIDADAMIVDVSRDIFEDLDPERSWGWVMHVAGNTLLPNSGVLALRSRPATIELLESAWSLRERYANHPWWEQAAINELLGFVEVPSNNSLRLGTPTARMSAVQFLGTEWNSIAIDQAPAPRIKHYAGLSEAMRHEAMTWDGIALENRAQPPAYDLSVILVMHDADAEAALRCLQSIAQLDEALSTQTVILAPPEGPLDSLLGALDGDVSIVRAHPPADHAIVGGLALARGSLNLIATGPTELDMSTLDRIRATVSADRSLLLHRDDCDLLVASRDMLPRTAWVGGRPANGRRPLDPALAALSGAGVPVLSASA